jgi:DNA-binding transcriptional LysR family regulator
MGTTSFGISVAAARSNMGIGLLFLSSVEADFQTGKFKRLRLIGADLDVHTHIVYRKQSLTPVVSNFIRILRQRQDKR